MIFMGLSLKTRCSYTVELLGDSKVPDILCCCVTAHVPLVSVQSMSWSAIVTLLGK